MDGRAEIDKAQGVRINLWAGLGMLALGMLALGLFFLVSRWLRPAKAPDSAPEPDGRRED